MTRLTSLVVVVLTMIAAVALLRRDERETTGATTESPPALERTSPTDDPRTAARSDPADPARIAIAGHTPPEGVRVLGRVTDRTGGPVGGLSVALALPSMPSERAIARSSDDGTFTFATPLPAGDRLLITAPATRLRPETRVTLAGAEHFLDVVVDTAIEGRVVDERGTPVRGAAVAIARRFSKERSTMTASDGAFRLEPNVTWEPGELVALCVDSAFCESLQTPPVHAFGTRDVVLTVRAGASLEVHVVRDVDDAPVEHFIVRLLRAPSDSTRWLDAPLRQDSASGHRNGVARFDRLRRGDYLLSIEPSRTTGLGAQWLIPTTVDGDAPTVQTVRLTPLVLRRVVVERADGRPVADAGLSLLLRNRHASISMTAVPTLVATDRTNASGVGGLQGASRTSYDVHVDAPGAAPRRIEDVQLDDQTPLRVVVSEGARLVGRLVPASAVPGIVTPLSVEPRSSSMNVVLVRPEDSPFTQLSRVFHHVDENGTFTIPSIPPGTWNVLLQQSVYRDGLIEARRELRSRVTLEEGRTTELHIDVSRFQTGQLNGTVRLDGVAYHGSLHLRCEDPEASISTDTDAEGRFSVVLDCGSWRPCVHRYEPTQGLMIAAPIVHVAPGPSVEAAFDLRSALARLRIRTSNDMPARYAKLVLHALDGSGVEYETSADIDGSRVLITAPGSYAVRARIRSLTDDEAWSAAVSNHGDGPDALREAFVDVGTFTLPTAGDVVDLRLPPQWVK